MAKLAELKLKQGEWIVLYLNAQDQKLLKRSVKVGRYAFKEIFGRFHPGLTISLMGKVSGPSNKWFARLDRKV